MIPVHVFGTLWLAEAWRRFGASYVWGVEPFLLWDFGKIVLLAFVTTKVVLLANLFFDEEEQEDVLQTNLETLPFELPFHSWMGRIRLTSWAALATSIITS